jgi:SAM-dependent methyltransferase
LAIIKSRTPAQYAEKLVCCLGQFPEQLDFPDASFDGIYNARLFHFFDGDRIRVALAKFHQWLKPGGRLFLVNDSVYRTIFSPLIAAYEKQVAAGDEWPGFIEDVASCISEYVRPDAFPKTMNFLDPVVLSRELTRARLKVMTAGFYPYTATLLPAGWMAGSSLASSGSRNDGHAVRSLTGNRLQ